MLSNSIGRKQVLQLTLVMVLAVASSTSAKVIYVDDDANAPGDGLSWRTAYKYLQDALTDTEAAEKPVEIRVAQGVYKPDQSADVPQGTKKVGSYFRLADGVSLYGGYAGVSGWDPNARDLRLYQTVLSGDLAGDDAPVVDPAVLMSDPARKDNCLVVWVNNGRSRLDGCVITSGGDGGLRVTGPSPATGSGVTISDCTFQGNRGSKGDAPSAGAATLSGKGVLLVRCSFIENAGDLAALEGSEVLLDSCQFIRNHGRMMGGAAHLSDSTITNCVFMENHSGIDGGALFLDASPSGVSRLTGCIFRRNSAARVGGAIACARNLEVRDCLFTANEVAIGGGAGSHRDGSAALVNCILVGNRSGTSGGAWTSGQRSVLKAINCTIAENRSPEVASLVIDYYGEVFSGRVRISNCILSNGQLEIWSSGPSVDLTYTCVRHGTKPSGGQNKWLAWGPGNIEADPCFADPGHWDPNGTPDDPNDDFFVEGDYHLKSQAGRWDPNSESWVMDEATSPCIDAGDPNSPVGDEPIPNGGRINMGAYGGTAEASMSYFGDAVGDVGEQPFD